MRSFFPPTGKYFICMMMSMLMMMPFMTLLSMFMMMPFMTLLSMLIIRKSSPDYTGRLCVIGSELEFEKLEKLFHLA